MDWRDKRLMIPANTDSGELNDLHLLRAMRNSSRAHQDCFKLSEDSKSLKSTENNVFINDL